MATHTPIPFWLAMPLGDACAWGATVREVLKEDATRGDG
jgi:hypothetical protein